MYLLKELFKQSEEDKQSVRMEGKETISNMLYGIQIIYDKGVNTHIIVNTTNGGDFFLELPHEEYQVFFEYGWLYGVYSIALKNYKRKLDLIEINIKIEVNSRKNQKHLRGLKSSRKRVLNKYSEVSKKLSKLLILN